MLIISVWQARLNSISPLEKSTAVAGSRFKIACMNLTQSTLEITYSLHVYMTESLLFTCHNIVIIIPVFKELEITYLKTLYSTWILIWKPPRNTVSPQIRVNSDMCVHFENKLIMVQSISGFLGGSDGKKSPLQCGTLGLILLWGNPRRRAW